MSILEVQNVCKKYKDKTVLNDVSFKVEEGEVLAIIGPSGSGKTTLLRCINQLEKINSGNIIVNDKHLIKENKNGKAIYNNKEILKQINLETGIVFQNYNLFPHLSVKKNLTNPLRCVLKKNKEEAEKIALEILEKMDLKNKVDSYPCELSGGQQQRVSIARAMVMKPKILFLDEPTSALDPELTVEVLKIIRKVAREKQTMVIVTHEIFFVEKIADRVIFMEDGKIVEEGTAKELIENSKEERVRRFINIVKTEEKPIKK